jgi:hypothetical protein
MAGLSIITLLMVTEIELATDVLSICLTWKNGGSDKAVKITPGKQVRRG